MTEIQKEVQPQQDGVNQPDTVSKLFENRDKSDSQRNDSAKEQALDAKNEKNSQVADKGDGKEDIKKETQEAPNQTPEPTLDDDKTAKPEDPDLLRKKLAKAEKMVLDNQRFGHRNAQKVRNALKATHRLVEDGALSEDEAKGVLAALHVDDGADDLLPHPAHQFAPIFKVANQELRNIEKYADDGLLQDKVEAFDYFLSIASQDEKDKLLKSLTDLMDDPLQLAKKMLSIGQGVFEESYKGIKDAGGLKNYLSQKDQELQKLHKNIDKLEKKLLQYEDFDTPRYRLDELAGHAQSAPAKDTISSLFEYRDAVSQR